MQMCNILVCFFPTCGLHLVVVSGLRGTKIGLFCYRLFPDCYNGDIIFIFWLYSNLYTMILSLYFSSDCKLSKSWKRDPSSRRLRWHNHSRQDYFKWWGWLQDRGWEPGELEPKNNVILNAVKTKEMILDEALRPLPHQHQWQGGGGCAKLQVPWSQHQPWPNMDYQHYGDGQERSPEAVLPQTLPTPHTATGELLLVSYWVSPFVLHLHMVRYCTQENRKAH